MTNKEKVVKKLSFVYGNVFAGCGIGGNIAIESGFLSNNLQNTANAKLKMTDEEYTKKVDNNEYRYGKYITTRDSFINDNKGYGLIQATNSSIKRSLYDYHKSLARSIGDLDTQIDWLIYMLNKDYKNVVKKLLCVSDLKTASNIFLHEFERPKDQSIKQENDRYNEAVKCFSEIFGKLVSWVKYDDGSIWYYIENGIIAKNKWVKYLDDWYYLNEYGLMATNAFIRYDGYEYYVKRDGKMAKSEMLNINGRLYTFDNEGISI